VATLWLWTIFSAGILLLLAFELILEARRPVSVPLREAALWSFFWVFISLAFGAFLWWKNGSGSGLEFFTGYIVEKSLSLDNLFIFVILFRQFSVPAESQRHVLLWGVVGALLMRAALIGAGAALVAEFHWTLQIFGVFLLAAGVHMLLQKNPAPSPAHNPMLRLARRLFPVSESFHGKRFFVRGDKGLSATPLLLVLIAVETADLVFAVDSIPAVFGITHDPFIVFSSNACAVLGLRSLYFLLAGILPRLRYLTSGLSFVLLFIGVRMISLPWLTIPTHNSLIVIAVILTLTIIASLYGSPRSSARLPEASTKSDERGSRA
jgi:tellurite resistance protein TerC